MIYSYQITFTCLLFCFVLCAQDGSMDQSFGTNGITFTDFENDTDYTRTLAIASDNSIWVLGTATIDGSYNPVIVRYLENGVRDMNFGTNGVLTPNGFKIYSLLDDGILVAGNLFSNGNSSIVVHKYRLDGSLDKSFGDQGMITLDILSADEYFYELFVNDDNGFKIVGASEANGFRSIVSARYSQNGTIDESYGNNGIAVSPYVQDEFIRLSEVKRFQDNSFLVTLLLKDNNLYLAKYLSDGAADRTFGIDGIMATAFQHTGPFAIATTTLPNNKILALMHRRGDVNPSDAETFFVRFLENGEIDSSFANNGIRHTSFPYFIPKKIIVQENNRLLVAGGFFTIEAALVDIKRFYSDGHTDTSFTGGTVDTYEIDFSDAVLQADGKIVAVGTTPFYTKAIDFAVFRFNNDVLAIVEQMRQQITISPNPSSTIFNLSCSQCDLTNQKYIVTDILGKTVLDGSFRASEYSIDLSTYQNGLYFLRIGSTTIKLLKK